VYPQTVADREAELAFAEEVAYGRGRESERR
jgi:hypothetical protein